jgi:hypothetical protein
VRPSPALLVHEHAMLTTSGACRAGGSTRVTVPVRADTMQVWTPQGKWKIEPGQFNVRVGTSDETYANMTLTVR